jgi:transposase
MEQKQTPPEKILPPSPPFCMLPLNWATAPGRWRAAMAGRFGQATVTARDLEQVQHALVRAQNHFAMTEGCSTVSCYEAGRDGFWLHQYLQGQGIDNMVVDSANLEVDRRLRRAKNDRIDAGKLLRMLIRFHGGEKQLWRVVRVPSREDEDARHLHRELESLKREGTRHRNRVHGILMQQGLCIPNPSKKRFLQDLEALRTWDGQQLPVGLKARLVRTYQQLRLVEDQISALAMEKREHLQQVDNAKMRQVAQLLRLPGIGPASSWAFVMEFFGWRRFRNRREVAALAGLTPTPYDSGRKLREQGISKAGNRRIRTL